MPDPRNSYNHAGAPRQRPGRGPGDRHPGEQPQAPEKAQKPFPFCDVHLRVGLEDTLVRIGIEDLRKIIVDWALDQQDVILRAAYENQETNIILRGCEGGTYTVHQPDRQRKLPRYKVVLAKTVREEMLRRAGHTPTG